MANAGRVELDLVAVGKDEVSAMLRKVEAQARQMATGMKEAGTATAGVGSQLDDLKGKASGVNKVREVFENLRSNAFFVVGAVTGLVEIVGTAVGAIVDLVDGANDAAKALAYWEAQQKLTNSAIEAGWKALDRFASSPLEAALADINAQLFKARLTLQDLKNDEDGRRQVLDDIKGLRAVQAGIEAQIATDQERQAEALDRIIARMHEASTIAPIISPFTGNADDLAVPVNDLGETPEMEAARRQRALDAAARMRRGGGSGPRERAGQRGDFFGQSLGVSGRFATNDAPSPFKEVDEALLSMFAEGGAAESGGESPLARMATDAEKLRDALQHVADAASLVAHTMPEMGAALGEVQAITAQVVDGKMQLTEALAAGATAIAANAAKAIGGVRAEAAVRAAYEVGMGFATLANPIVSAGHFTAAALLGAVAAGAGGGGGGRAGGSSRGERADSGGSGGPATIVYNFSSLVTDQQQVTTALRRAGRSSRGTGHESRAGV